MTILSLKTLQKAIHTELRYWSKADHKSDPVLSNLYLVCERLNHAGDNQANRSSTTKAIIHELIEEAIEELDSIDPTGASILKQQFFEEGIIKEIAQKLDTDIHAVNRLQKKAREQTAGILFDRENICRNKLIQQHLASLPQSGYTHLFGFEQVAEQLEQHLLSDESQKISLITGIGGIGKTSLADLVVRRIIPTFRFNHIIWIRFEHNSMSGEELEPEAAFEQIILMIAEQLPNIDASLARRSMVQEIRRALQTPHLIVVDNIESLESIAYQVDALAVFAGPSHILFTTRAVPMGSNRLEIPLSELSRIDSFALIRHEAEAAQLPELVMAADDQLQVIYNKIGGNPLAIKLVVALAKVVPLEAVLADLKTSKDRDVLKMYRRIFVKAWQALTEPAQKLLMMMPLIGSDGTNADHLKNVSELEDAVFWQAIRLLVSRSLLEVRGTAFDRMYGIHRLTEAFLLSDIIGGDFGDQFV